MESVFCFVARPSGNAGNLLTTFRNEAYLTMMKDEQTQGSLFGVEPEFFVCKKSTPDGAFIPVDLNNLMELKTVKQDKWYSCLPPLDSFHNLRIDIAKAMETAGFEIEAIHHEVAPGQCEFSWKCDSLLRTADKMMIFKYIVNAICATYEFRADFRAKPFKNLNGSGCHVHQSIPMMINAEGKPNAKIVEAYAGGLVDHYDELLEVCCVGYTSHDRLVPGFEAPTKENNGWGWYDRTKTVRIVGDGGHLEYRLPDPEMNPYVALPMMLEFGYQGVLESK